MSRRDRIRFISLGFDLAPFLPTLCPPDPPSTRFFRIDWFSAAADRKIDTRDRTRFTAWGFDIASVRPCDNLDTYINDPLAAAVAVTDRDILNEIQLHVVEPPDLGQSILSGLWTIPEIIDYLNQRQRQFLTDTGVVYQRADVSTIPQVQRHPLPDDWSVTERVSFDDLEGGVNQLHRVDEFELDNGSPSWQKDTETRPRYYTDTLLPYNQIQTVPQARDAGTLKLLYIGLGTTLSNTGVEFSVPDECVPAIKWGVLANMLSKVGRATDPARAAYCESRYREGVIATKLLVRGQHG